jgi:Rad3-related DNA helicase
MSSPVAHEKIMKNIFPDVKTKIFISATMWVFSKGSDGFNYSRRILGLGEDFRAIKLGSSFDYRNQLKFYVIEDMIEYSHNNLEYLKEGAELIQNIIKIGKGGILTLFTSYRDMEYVKNVVHTENINLKVQEKLLSQTKLIEEHIKQKDSILFGNRTFWEGIDLPGEHLKILVIFKLPFERPDDPIIESRINHFGEKSFHEGLYKYYYPKMITNLRQGIGRLIRTKSDRGIVIVLDNRVVDQNRNYSNKILRSMPPGIEAVSILKKNLLRTMKTLKKEGFI